MAGVEWFDDLETLMTHVGGDIPVSVSEDVAREVEKILRKHIQSDIYGAYRPQSGMWVYGTTYVRRSYLEDYVYHEILPDGTLLVSSNAVANQSIVPGYEFSNEENGFLQLLESGHMGIWRNGFPRPVIANAQKEADNSPVIRAIAEKGMEREMNR